MTLVAPEPGIKYWYDGVSKLVAPGYTPLSAPGGGGGGGGSGGGGAGGMPAYPPMLAGWTQSGVTQLDTSSRAGWAAATGSENQSAAIMEGFDLIDFGVGPLSDAARIQCVKSGSEFHSGELRGTQAPYLDSHVVEWYQQMGPLGSGSFPSVWASVFGSGNGELDYYEWRGRFVSDVTNDSNDRMTLNVITTPYGSTSKQTPRGFHDKLAGFNIDETQWCHFRAVKTNTSVTLYINGIQVSQILRNETRTTNTISNALWDANFAAGNQWYLRISQQFGIGAKSVAAGTPDLSLLPSDLWIRDIRLWKAA